MRTSIYALLQEFSTIIFCEVEFIYIFSAYKAAKKHRNSLLFPLSSRFLIIPIRQVM